MTVESRAEGARDGGFDRAADALGVPLLFTAYEVPFSALGRAVAEANRSEEHARVLETLRLYETLRHAAAAAEPASLLTQIEQVVGGKVHVVDHERGVSVMPHADEPPRAVVDVLARRPSGRGRVPCRRCCASPPKARRTWRWPSPRRGR